MIVAHPPSGNTAYYDLVSELRVPGNTLYVSVSSTATAAPQSNVSLDNFWSTKVFDVQKGSYNVLAIEYQTDTSFFQLKK